VAENETFDVLLGVADSIKLSRVLDRKYSALRRGSRTRLQVAFDVGVENLSDQPTEVRLFDRIPVSEDREVRVFDVSVEPSGKPDSKGLLRWDLQLAARAKQIYRIAYTVEYPPAMVRQERAKATAGEAVPAADLYLQIESLESKF
jgi:hypothetical protein